MQMLAPRPKRAAARQLDRLPSRLCAPSTIGATGSEAIRCPRSPARDACAEGRASHPANLPWLSPLGRPPPQARPVPSLMAFARVASKRSRSARLATIGPMLILGRVLSLMLQALGYADEVFDEGVAHRLIVRRSARR